MIVSAYVPAVADLRALAGTIITLGLFHILGAAASGRRQWPEVQIAAGWGIACLVLTVWGAATPLPLRLPMAGLGLAAVLCVAVPRLRARINCVGLGRMALLTLPLWLVVLPMRPSQVDTWLNLLPNAAYLFDHDMLPRADRPPSWSFLPVAPYNSQFAGDIASVATGAFAPNAMGLFNVALLILGALLLARIIAQEPGRTPPWYACAAALLLALPLNPGFVPRSFFAPYGEPSLAVTTLFAVWLATRVLTELRAGSSPSAVPLALILAALVNIKQSGIGLALPIGAGFLLMAWIDRGIPRGRAIVTALGVLAPALLLYAVWRVYVAASGFTAGELQPMPMAAWNLGLLPWILAAIAKAMFQKAAFYLCLFAVIGVAAWRWRAGADRALLGLIAVAAVLFNGFILTTYIVHFPPEMATQAHSFYRYGTQISLIVLLGLIVILRPFVVRALGRLPDGVPVFRRIAVAAALAFPLALLPLLRFDLDPPQTDIFALGHAVAAELGPRDRLAVLVPGDQFDATASMIRGVMLFTAPRRPALDLRTDYTADDATLRAAGQAGYDLALVSCTPAGMANIPPNVAALLRRTPDGWQPVKTWTWRPALKHERFAALLARGPLCANPP